MKSRTFECGNRGLGLKTIGALAIGAALAVVAGPGCGKPPTELQKAIEDKELIPVKGAASFGSQCPYGTFAEPQPVGLALWDCPLNVDTLELVEPPQPITLVADCKKKLINARYWDATQKRNVDSAWEVMPDGSFYFTLDGFQTRLNHDGAGNTNCTTQLGTTVFGSLNCKPDGRTTEDRDRVNINFDVVWRMGHQPQSQPSATPSPQPSPQSPRDGSYGPPGTSPGNGSTLLINAIPRNPALNATPTNECTLPAGCYLHTNTVVRQCE